MSNNNGNRGRPPGSSDSKGISSSRTNGSGASQSGPRHAKPSPKPCHKEHYSTQLSQENLKAVENGSNQNENSITCGTRGEPADTSAENRGVKSGVQDPSAPLRLLLVSSKIKNNSLMQSASLPSVIFVQYKYESTSLEGILGLVSHNLGPQKVASIALVLTGSGSSIYLTGKDEKVINKETVTEQCLREFFHSLVTCHLDQSWPNARVDFLACQVAQNGDAAVIAHEIQAVVQVPVGISKDVSGSDIQLDCSLDESKTSFVGELYFRLERIRNGNGHNQQTLAGFEKIRTVGKGAYGTAVLYRKKDDDSLVILKEINLHDLNASERQLALNEVKVLAMLDHPNIISYYDSFEEDGIVMIEMEYADGGTLSQHLTAQDKPLEEKEILCMFQQMVAAIKHIHEHNILHRDLKTANIFLTKEGVVKVGDFGISKLMSTTNQGANTVLGTPYYISPEMCEGKPYNDKSDIWALGCILYEMACLQRTFEGSNLPALVNKIMKGQFAPVKGNYSQEFKYLIRDMLQREPEYRPSASELWHSRLPELLCQYEDPVTDYEDELMTSSENSLPRKKKTSSNVMEKRSVLYYLEMTAMSLTPVELPASIKIRDVAVGLDHVIVVTMERSVFTWGEGQKGQLGHGALESLYKPELVEGLKGKSIVRACCGDGFSVFASDNGIVMTCGDGTFGCLGHEDWCSTSRPRLIEALLSVDVIAIACGLQHVVAVGSEGEVFSWGRGADGRLGLGTEEDVCLPTEVSFSDSVCVRDVRCGHDGTMLLTDVGSVLACGNNQYNKVGLNQRQGFLMAMKNIFNKTEVEGQKEFTLVKALARHRVIDISMGSHHTAVVVEPGHVYAMGRNTEGQLGNGNTKQQNGLCGVKTFEDKPAFRVQCGEYYTVAGTLENDILIWGMKPKLPPQLGDSQSRSGKQADMRVESAGSVRSSHSRQPSTASIGSSSHGNSTENIKEGLESSDGGRVGSGRAPERQASTETVLSSGGDKLGSSNNSTSSKSGFRPLSSSHRARSSSNNSRDKERELACRDDTELILQPTPLLRMDSSGSHSSAGDTVTLSNFFCHGQNLFLQVETTAPPPKRKPRRRRNFRRRLSQHALEIPSRHPRMSASSRDGGDEYSSETSEYDTYGTIPAWIKQELASSEMDADNGMEGDDTSDHSDDDTPGQLQESSMSSIQINRNLKQGSKIKMDKKEVGRGVGQMGVKSGSDKENQSRLSHKTSSVESGVEFTPADPLSSSSSSETMANAMIGDDARIRAAVVKKPLTSPPKRIAGPAPFKSKSGPTPGQKPLNRIRAQNRGRTKGPEISRDSAISRASADADIKQKEDNINSLQSELEKMREEKRKTEERLQQMEEEQKKHQKTIWQEAEKQAKERESHLKGEIVMLRSELHQQSSKLQDNLNVVLSLQEQLVKVQSEQLRMSSMEQAPPRQSARESRICAIQ